MSQNLPAGLRNQIQPKLGCQKWYTRWPNIFAQQLSYRQRSVVFWAKLSEAVEAEPLCRSERTVVWRAGKLTLRRSASHYSWWCSRVKTRGCVRSAVAPRLLKKYMTIVWRVQLVAAGFSSSPFPPTNLRSSLSSHVMGSRQQCWWTFALGEFLCKLQTHTPGYYYCDSFLPSHLGTWVEF